MRDRNEAKVERWLSAEEDVEVSETCVNGASDKSMEATTAPT